MVRLLFLPRSCTRHTVLKYRLITGSALIAALALIVFWPHRLAAALFLVFGGGLVLLATREFFGIAKGLGAKGFPRLTCLATLTLAILPGASACFSALATLPEFLLEQLVMAVFLVASFALVFRSEDFSQGVRDFFVSVAAFFYIGWSLHFLSRIYFWGGDLATTGRYLFLYVVIVTKFGDIGGYTLGKLASLRPGGNHKMVPRVSPGKSWEGLLGSVLFSVGIALVLSHFLGDRLHLDTRLEPALLFGQVASQPVSGWSTVLVAVSLALLGLISDLTESVLKRAGGVKDSGTSLPGMGGVLDAVDSLVLVSPVFYCYLLFVTKF